MKHRDGSLVALAAVLLLVVVTSFGCARTSPPPAQTPASAATPAPEAAPGPAADKLDATYGGGDGLSCATRVIVKADGEMSGVAAEYTWLRARYPGYKRGMQSLSRCDGVPADILQIRTREGQTLDIYFDISSFFGKL